MKIQHRIVNQAFFWHCRLRGNLRITNTNCYEGIKNEKLSTVSRDNKRKGQKALASPQPGLACSMHQLKDVGGVLLQIMPMQKTQLAYVRARNWPLLTSIIILLCGPAHQLAVLYGSVYCAITLTQLCSGFHLYFSSVFISCFLVSSQHVI